MDPRTLWIRSAALGLALSTALAAQTQPGTADPQAAPPAAKAAGPPPCTGAAYQQFDFWLGEWIVKDTKTGEIIAFDRIQKINDGCTLLQDVNQVNDQFRACSTASPGR